MKARIYALDGEHSGKAIHGATLTTALGWHSFVWGADGKAYQSDPVHDYDLVGSACRRCCGRGQEGLSREPCSTDTVDCSLCGGSGFEA